MAFIPGATIHGEFKLFCQMSTEELEYVIARQKIRMLLVLVGTGLLTGLILAVIYLGAR